MTVNSTRRGQRANLCLGVLKCLRIHEAVIKQYPLARATLWHGEKQGNGTGHGCQLFTLGVLGEVVQSGTNSWNSLKLSTFPHEAVSGMHHFFFFLNSGALFTSEGTSTTTITKNEIPGLSLPTSMESVQLEVSFKRQVTRKGEKTARCQNSLWIAWERGAD